MRSDWLQQVAFLSNHAVRPGVAGYLHDAELVGFRFPLNHQIKSTSVVFVAFPGDLYPFIPPER